MTIPTRTFCVDRMPVEIYASNEEMGAAVAQRAAEVLRATLAKKGQARMVLATGNSQLTFHQALRALPGIAWNKVDVFHMDEYAGMGPDHPASFRRFLHEKVIDHVHPRVFNGVCGEAPDPQAECERYSALLRAAPIDLCCLGIGENGHIAFNDPPYADFDDPAWVKMVRLDEKSRRQQVGEGHFPALDSVPTHAMSMTIPALLAAETMLCIVPERRKAEAVRAALTGPLTEDCPASILRTRAYCSLYLDADAAALLV